MRVRCPITLPHVNRKVCCHIAVHWSCGICCRWEVDDISTHGWGDCQQMHWSLSTVTHITMSNHRAAARWRSRLVTDTVYSSDSRLRSRYSGTRFVAVLYISYLTTEVDFLCCSVMDHCWSFQLEFHPDTTKSYVATEQRRSITLALTPSVASEVLDEQECQSIFHFSPHSQYSYLYSQSSLSAGGRRPWAELAADGFNATSSCGWWRR